MDLLPPEVLILVLKAAAFSGPKNDVVALRLVCREFDAILKPLLCDTVSLDISKLSKRSCVKHPDPDALQTIGQHCKSLFVDLLAMREPMEVLYLQSHVETPSPMSSLFESMLKRHCIGSTTFTEADFRNRLDDVLFNCRGIERVRLGLPLPFVVTDELTTTFILANALAALGHRPEEDSATLKVLVLESVTGGALSSLLYNPLDRRNIMTVFEGLAHLVLSTKGNASYLAGRTVLSPDLWRFIGMAESLKTLCLVGLECGSEPPSSALRFSSATLGTNGMPESVWQEPMLPPPVVALRHLTCLELRRVDISSNFFVFAASAFGSTLRELYLNKVCLKIQKSPDGDGYPVKDLWVGLPNTSPKADDRWIAHVVRKEFREIRVCRATHLSYDFYGIADDLEALQGLDIDDPCSLKRDLARRFVEVVMGYEQPALKLGGPCTMLPHTTQLQQPLKPAPEDMQPSSWDVAAYHNLVANPTSRWLDSIDGHFPNDRSTSTMALRDIAESMCRGLNTVPTYYFHPGNLDSGFRVVYDNSIPLGFLIGRIGPQVLDQLGVGPNDELDENWTIDNDGLLPWTPSDQGEDDSGGAGDGEPDESDSGEEGDNETDDDPEEEGYHEHEPWGYLGIFPMDDPMVDLGLPVVFGYVNSPNVPDGDGDGDGQDGIDDDDSISSGLGEPEPSIEMAYGLI